MRCLIHAGAVSVALVVAVASAPAAGPEDAYLAARDEIVAKLKAMVDAEKRGPMDDYGPQIIAMEEQGRAGLDRQMRAILGPVVIRGMEQKGALNLDSLLEGDMGFGLLDGMIYGAVDARTRVIVTTDGLFRRWLRQHKNWWGEKFADMPQEPAAAVQENAFYTQAVPTDAAILRFATLPVRKPAGADFAFAMLAARTQDDPPKRADEIFVAMARGGRVFVAFSKELAPLGPIAGCETVRAGLIKKAEQASTEAGLDDEARSAKSEALRSKSEQEFLRCFAGRASAQKGFAAAVQAAEALIARLPDR